MDRDKGSVIIRSSKSDLVNFKNSIVYKDLKRELVLWLRAARSEYPQVDTLLDKGRIDGRGEALVYVFGLVDNMIEVLDDREEEEKDDS